MKKYLIFSIIVITAFKLSAQQVDVSSDIRARYEYRHGYASLIDDTAKAANFVTQRTRINIDYKSSKIKLRISPQNVKVWGDVVSNSKSDLNMGFHEAYGEAIVNEYFSIKVGRQEINYDDARIFGNVDWSMQARSHDALLFKINPDTNNKIQIGLALNANKETNFQDNYLLPQYKAMQYLWYHGDFKNMGWSILALNNGLAYLDKLKEKVAYSQTIGSRLTYKNTKVKLDAAAYMQTGKIALNTVNAYYLSTNASFQFTNELYAGVGFEYLSGKATNDKSTDIKSFNPLYGTNHKFNGFMDYFYVGNHINSVGLTDIYAHFGFEKDKVILKFAPHYFMTAADIYKGTVKQNKTLGTELDFTFGYKLVENVKVEAGYSQLVATSSMQILKGGNTSNTNNWFYLSLIFNPKLFTYKK